MFPKIIERRVSEIEEEAIAIRLLKRNCGGEENMKTKDDSSSMVSLKHYDQVSKTLRKKM